MGNPLSVYAQDKNDTETDAGGRMIRVEISAYSERGVVRCCGQHLVCPPRIMRFGDSEIGPP